MSRLSSSSRGPTPERCSSCGEAMAPELTMTSLRARASTRSSLSPTVGHADGALAVEQHAVGQGVGDDGQIRTLLGLVQIAAGGAGATTVLGHGTVHRTEAFLLVAVEVFGTWVTRLHAGFDHGVEQWVVASFRRGHADRAFAAVVVVRADIAGFGLAEVRQAVRRSSLRGLAISPSRRNPWRCRGYSTCR